MFYCSAGDATQRLSAVKWGLSFNIFIAWIITLPAAAAVGARRMGPRTFPLEQAQPQQTAYAGYGECTKPQRRVSALSDAAWRVALLWPAQFVGHRRRQERAGRAGRAAGLAQLSGRVEAYMLKAGREAKVNSSWFNPNTEYEEATRDFVRALLCPQPDNPFLQDFLPFQQRIARMGAFNSLSQVLLKLASPGVPDIYQGNEVWDFSLVDPDNRRMVDYEARHAALRAIKTLYADAGTAACAQHLLENLPDGRIKLYLTWKILTLRREHEAVFRDGDYLPLKVYGEHAEQVVAFTRHSGEETLLAAAPRLFGGLMRNPGQLPVGEAAWGDTWIDLPPERVHEKRTIGSAQ